MGGQRTGVHLGRAAFEHELMFAARDEMVMRQVHLPLAHGASSARIAVALAMSRAHLLPQRRHLPHHLAAKVAVRATHRLLRRQTSKERALQVGSRQIWLQGT
jgi:hypothetical protein